VAAHVRRQNARLALLAVQDALGRGAAQPLPPAGLVAAGAHAVPQEEVWGHRHCVAKPE